jgi:hypothetical protein
LFLGRLSYAATNGPRQAPIRLRLLTQLIGEDY